MNLTGSYFYSNHPKTCDPDDYWGQVKRTVNGKPVPQEQIDMIVSAVNDGLQLETEDHLLDLCCGNGALTTYFFSRCRGGLGVDTSDFLIDVARENFVRAADQAFILGDVLDFVEHHAATEKFTKALCYGAITYLGRDQVRQLLTVLRARFSGVRRLFIGNIADADKARLFYGDSYRPGIENDSASPIGLWWTQREFADVAAASGWDTEIRRMPQEYYAAHYRFDAVLTPAMRTGGE